MTAKQRRRVNPLRADPTRLAALRRLFDAALRRRFVAFRRAVVRFVGVEDAFGLRGVPGVPPAVSLGVSSPLTANAFRFESSAGKLAAFKRWLDSQIVRLITGTATPGSAGAPSAAPGAPLPSLDVDPWAWYVEQGFRKGAGRAFDDARRAAGLRATVVATTPEGVATTTGFAAGGRDEFLRSAFGRPVSVERVQVLVSRTFTDIEGVTSKMATTLTRVLADGLTQGKGPADVARDIAEKVDMSYRQARIVATTELSRAHAEGQLLAFESMGVEELGVMVEWTTAGDYGVCPKCQAMQGVVLKVSEAHGVIPRHSSCRCAFLPAQVGESTKGQVRTKRSIDRAIKRSTADDAAGTGWGPARSISAKRPEGIV